MLLGSPAMPFKTFSITKGERLDTDLSLLVNVSLGSTEKLNTSVDYARSLTCQSRFHVAVSFYFVTLWGLKLKKP